MYYPKRSWLEIDLDAIAHNAREIKALLPEGCLFCGVVKANGYGHGEWMVARTLLEAVDADWFAVSNIEEARSLRRGGFQRPILILGYTAPEEAASLAEEGITQALLDEAYARKLSRCAQAAGVTVPVHIKVDTGMSRLGFAAVEPEERAANARLMGELAALPGLKIGGCFTHFAVADEERPSDLAFTQQQIVDFQDFCNQVEAAGVPLAIKHCCNSAGCINYSQAAMDMARPGTCLYGFAPGTHFGHPVKLRPAMNWYATVSMVKTLAPGREISYGLTYQVDHPVTVATVAVGFADGMRRGLSNQGVFLIHGQEAPIVGRVCMDQLLVDVTHIPNVAEGDRVTLIGRDGDLERTFAAMAQQCATTPFELACNVGPRVPRLYRKDGKLFALATGETHYIEE